MAHFRHTPPTVEEIERQIRWEGEATERGIRRYREMMSSASVADTAPGQMAIRDIMKRLVPVIETKQKEAVEAIATAGAGRQPEWWWILPLLDAHQWAYLTVRAVFADPYRDMGTHHKVTALAQAVAKSAQQQLDFEKWRATEQLKAKVAREDAKAAAEAGEEVPRHVNFYEALKRNAKRIDSRAFSKWSKKIGRMVDEPWPVEARLMLGVLLLDLTVEHSGGWFEIKLVPQPGGKTERHLIVSDAGMEAMNDLNTRKEVARPLLMPMVCKPKRWVLVTPKEQSK